ncbi:hypothetical protein [Mycolicibacterium gadium]|uniref:hypothetical protein n=1 Tax=Mycolicibacterium gadium TaxID=1794 RepID=UPI002FDE1E95
MTSDDGPTWGDQRTIAMWGGGAILLLVVILVYAVSCTADSSRVPETLPTAPSSSATPSTYTTLSASSTRYTTPSVETSQDNPVIPWPTPETSAESETTG